MMLRSLMGIPLAMGAMVALLSACGPEAPESPAPSSVAGDSAANPFLAPSPLPYGLPPFDQIEHAHFAPAFAAGMAEERAQVEGILGSSEAPSFENTIVALEKTGAILDRVSRVFYALSSAHTNDDIRALRAELAPQLAAHRDAIMLNPELFERVAAVHAQREARGLQGEALRLVEETYKDFQRAGAALDDEARARLKEINGALAKEGAAFSDAVLAEVNASAIVVEDEAELAGVSEDRRAALAQAAEDAGLGPNRWLISLRNTTGQPVVADLTHRPLRERVQKASEARGHRGGEFDNRARVLAILKLRAEKAALLGFENYAAYAVANQTAETPEAVEAMLSRLAPRAVANARREGAALQTLIDREGGGHALEAWDWSFYTEKLRAERYAIDAEALKPYFEMNRVLRDGVFHFAGQLYGLRFEDRPALPTYHPDVQVFEVFLDDAPLGLFLFDPYARPSKRGGAWMNAYVSQSELLGTQAVVANHLNIVKPAPGRPTLLTFDEVNTMFHEFGHALHGLFSNVTYPRFSGTRVPRDFVEFPSQVHEMGATWPSILKNYAVHHETGEPLPEAELEKVLAAQRFNEGFRTTEYLAAASLDQALHRLPVDALPEAEALMALEASLLTDLGFDYAPVPPRYRTPYFSHIMGGYAAGYYSYIWSEVLDADTVAWFKANGGLTRENGDRFRERLLSKGSSEPALTLFEDFRGAPPSLEPLLERRGLTD